jgi:hypothetical protein
MPSAQPKLVLDRGIPLQIRRVPGVKGDTNRHRRPRCWAKGADHNTRQARDNQNMGASQKLLDQVAIGEAPAWFSTQSFWSDWLPPKAPPTGRENGGNGPKPERRLWSAQWQQADVRSENFESVSLMSKLPAEDFAPRPAARLFFAPHTHSLAATKTVHLDRFAWNEFQGYC